MRKYLLLVLLLSGKVFAQPITQQAVKANISAYADSFPQERIYIQFDKPVYATGQTVWFKAYLINWADISSLSKTLYVDFTDDKGAVLIHGVYPVWNASAAGSFDIGDNYKSKNLHVHAYTKWMLNFDDAFLYSKEIRIVSNVPTGNKVELIPAVTASLQFFPEGGDCVEGVKCRVAFKANYQNGMPADIRGVVSDSKGNVVDSIKSVHDGMGFFYLEPAPGEIYMAKWADSPSSEYQTQLPVAKPIGAVIEINLKKLGAAFMVARSDDAPEEMKQMHIVATMQQQVVYMAPVNLAASPITGGVIPITNLASGIMQVTLFDANWKPIGERIVFVNNKDYRFEPAISVDSLGLTKRGKNVISIDVPDSIQTNLSVSITDGGLGVDSSDDIISRLLLTSDLKGRVYHPGYYFSNNTDSLSRQLDLVMLTNGWRRYKWGDIVNGTAPAIKYPRDTAWLNFSGQLYGPPKQIKNVANLLAIVSQKGRDSSQQYLTMPIKSNGSFSKPGFVFFDTLKVYYQFLAKSGLGMASTAEVNFNSGIIAPLTHEQIYKISSGGHTFIDTAGNYRASILAAEEAKIQQLLKNATLKGVTVKTRVKSRMQLMDEKYVSGLFSGSNAYQFDLVNDPLAGRTIDIFHYLTIKVAGLTVNDVGFGQGWISYEGNPLNVYVDEIPSDLNAVSVLNMNDIAYIKVFRAPFLGSFSSLGASQNGAVAIYTRRGDDIKNGPNSAGLQFKLVAGYTAVKEFYSPNYGDADQPATQQDIRSTLYWNPLVLTTPKKHKVKLRFYNNDLTGQFRVVLEGLGSDGKFTRVEKVVK